MTTTKKIVKSRKSTPAPPLTDSKSNSSRSTPNNSLPGTPATLSRNTSSVSNSSAITSASNATLRSGPPVLHLKRSIEYSTESAIASGPPTAPVTPNAGISTEFSTADMVMITAVGTPKLDGKGNENNPDAKLALDIPLILSASPEPPVEQSERVPSISLRPAPVTIKE